VDSALQDLSEQIIKSVVNCYVGSIDCIPFDSYVVISSFKIECDVEVDGINCMFITIDIYLFPSQPNTIISIIEKDDLISNVVKEFGKASEEGGIIYRKLTCTNEPSSGPTSVSSSGSPSVSKDIVIEYTFTSNVCAFINVQFALQALTESIVQSAANSYVVSTGFISYNIFVIISSFIIECDDESDSDIKCAFITIKVNLFLNEPDVIVSTNETNELRVIIIKEFDEAVKEGGTIYRKLACTNESASSPTSLTV